MPFKLFGKKATGAGYEVAKRANNLADKGSFLSGNDAVLNRKAKIPPSVFAKTSMTKVLAPRGIQFIDLTQYQYNGVVMPSTCTILGYIIAKLMGEKYNKMLSQQVRSFDGDLSTLTFFDYIGPVEKAFAGGILTPRMVCNLLNSMAITQQQAALNMAIMEYFIFNPSSQAAQIANFIASAVGDKWGGLHSKTFGGPGINSINSQTGVFHLYNDVPEAIELYIKIMLEKNPKVTAEWIEDLIFNTGAGCEIAKQSAIGALGGTQDYIKEMEKNLVVFRSYLPFIGNTKLAAAKGFFTEAILEGGIETRNFYIFAAIRRAFASANIHLEMKVIVKHFNAGVKAVSSEASNVKDIARCVSPKLAIENKDVAESVVN